VEVFLSTRMLSENEVAAKLASVSSKTEDVTERLVLELFVR
jgi:hypothetical protein